MKKSRFRALCKMIYIALPDLFLVLGLGMFIFAGFYVHPALGWTLFGMVLILLSVLLQLARNSEAQKERYP